MWKYLLIALIALLSACSNAGANTPPPQGTLTIDTIKVDIAESEPVQVFVHVQGYLGDGCTSLGAIEQQRNDNVVEVTIQARHSGAEVCTMIAPVVDERIQLEGDFPPGGYIVRVNGVEQIFTI
ncbi:MAG: hypothetical protein MI924_19305 [Chloroflexales bacterium]|nr:hypothetical protein [Chloroflexales bacterium]